MKNDATHETMNTECTFPKGTMPDWVIEAFRISYDHCRKRYRKLHGREYDPIIRFLRDTFTPCLVFSDFLRELCEDKRCRGGTFKLKAVCSKDDSIIVNPYLYNLLKKEERDD